MTPVFVATWRFGKLACETGIKALLNGSSALDAIELGGNAVELDPEVDSVGYGGLPNADGVVELDAAIMDGVGHRAGSVAALTGIRTPISVARRIMERTPHVMLAGPNAQRFAIQQGFQVTELLTDAARKRWEAWKQNRTAASVAHFDKLSHDTIGLVALDKSGNVAAGCTTSGLAFKLPGRVGDSPIIGSGLYVDNEVGAAAATGNGDEMMKACLSIQAVSLMERGSDPQEACERALAYLLRKRPEHQKQGAAMIALRRDGKIGSAATRAGFTAPGRSWIYARTEGEKVIIEEGRYVSS
jgi:isoaspartyl peptidase/L-asparaginase-like protein (Ntn-hydrolase superfamily)